MRVFRRDDRLFQSNDRVFGPATSKRYRSKATFAQIFVDIILGVQAPCEEPEIAEEGI